MRPELQQNEFSSWTDFPEQYKFFGLHLELNPQIRVIQRRTYDLFDMARDLAGVFLFFNKFFRCIVTIFSTTRLNALISNRLFYLSQRYKDDVKNLNNNKFKTMRNGEMRLDNPRYIDLEYLRYTVCWCKQSKTFAKYQELVSIASQDFTRDLDIVRMVRRQRMTAISLFFLQNGRERAISGRLAQYKVLRNKQHRATTNDDVSRWDDIQNISFFDRIQYTIYHRYLDHFLVVRPALRSQESIRLSSVAKTSFKEARKSFTMLTEKFSMQKAQTPFQESEESEISIQHHTQSELMKNPNIIQSVMKNDKKILDKQLQVKLPEFKASDRDHSD